MDRVRVSSGNPNQLIIMIMVGKKCIAIHWNSEHEFEEGLYEVSASSEVIFDKNGVFYIVDGHQLVDTNEKIRLQCFDLEGRHRREDCKINMNLG